MFDDFDTGFRLKRLSPKNTKTGCVGAYEVSKYEARGHFDEEEDEE